MINKVMLIGRLGADPEVKKTKNGDSFANLSLATNKKFKDSEKTTLDLWKETGVRVLPGAYLAQEKNGRNPGQNFIRVALVAQHNVTGEALTKIRSFLDKQ